MTSNKSTVKSFIEESFLPGSSTSEVGDDTSFLDIGLIDSTGILELVDFLEEQFGVEIEDEELVPENLDSITNICRYLESKGAATDGG
jgi:acyl carrier protein